MQPGRPFSRQEVVDRYEEWYATPYGTVVDRIEQRMLLELLRPLEPGASILDVGCGTGHFAAALARNGLRVFGVDREPAMLSTARERVSVACANGLRLPFRDATFDATVLVAVLEFVGDPVALLLEASRVTRHRIVVLTLTSWSWLGLRRRFSGWLGHPVFSQARFRSRSQVLAIARDAGLELVRLRTGLFLPPALSGRLPRLEERLSTNAFPCGGVLGLALRNGPFTEAAARRSKDGLVTSEVELPSR